MRNLVPAQLKGLSEFLNTVAAAWFSAGAISPFFTKIESLTKTILLSTMAIALALSFLFGSVYLLRRVRL